MSNAPLGELGRAVAEAAAAISTQTSVPSVRLERPKRENQGDYATNAAMLLAPAMRSAPRAIAEQLAAELERTVASSLTRVEVAGPGFLNLFVSDAWLLDALQSILAAGPTLGAGQVERPERILLEFISANPTGPLVAASGRHAAYGDALARILEHQGHIVEREYYLNDAGNQIRLFGASVQARAKGEEVPEGGYQGEYVKELAAEIPDAEHGEVDAIATEAVARMVARIEATLARYGVTFDRFFSEKTLHNGETSAITRALAVLRERGHLYDSEGATWLRTTSFGDDKDRVVVRSTGEPTYLSGDIAYIQDKLQRGYDRQLITLATDHHAYVQTLKAVMSALAGSDERLEIMLMQFVHLVEGDERAGMSKRKGIFVTLDALLDEIGTDAARYFMLSRSIDRTMDLDLDLARRQSAENPVYYIQYAHARIASMLRRVGDERTAEAAGATWSAVPLEPSERTLIKQLVAFPGELHEAAERRAPHRIATYALELAQDFTAFYGNCKVVGAQPSELEARRIALAAATAQVIRLALGLLGVSAPEQM